MTCENFKAKSDMEAISKLSDSYKKQSAKGNVFRAKVTIENECDDKFNETSFEYFLNKSQKVLITFVWSKGENQKQKIFWKCSNEEKLQKIHISDDSTGSITDYCEKFLFEAMNKSNLNGKFNL